MIKGFIKDAGDNTWLKIYVLAALPLQLILRLFQAVIFIGLIVEKNTYSALYSGADISPVVTSLVSVVILIILMILAFFNLLKISHRGYYVNLVLLGLTAGIQFAILKDAPIALPIAGAWCFFNLLYFVKNKLIFKASNVSKAAACAEDN